MRLLLSAPGDSPRRAGEALERYAHWLGADSGHEVEVGLERSPGPEFDLELVAAADAGLPQVARSRVAFVRTPGELEAFDAAPSGFFIATTRAAADAIGRRHPAAIVHVISDGVDKQTFTPLESVPVTGDEPLCILAAGGPRPAEAALERMSNPCDAVLVSTASRRFAKRHGFARVVDPLDVQKLAELYRWADVVLRLDPHDGPVAASLEGFLKAATCVTAPAPAGEPWLEPGWNGLLAEFADSAAVAALLDRLADERPALQFLKRNALDTARLWPDWRQACNSLALALEDLARRTAARAA